jgi:outer membrane receptor protein involved in Fe transport
LAASASPLSLAVLTLVCIWLSFPANTQAQVSTATVNGTVHDSSGAVIPGATVVLHNVAQNVDRSVTTNDVGYYLIENIISGNYKLSVSKQGFTTAQQSDITLVVNQTATFDMTLAPGVVTQVVNVAAQAAALEASTAELGVAVVRTEVNDLPLNGRNFTQLLNLTPGVSTVDVSQNAAGAGGIWSTPIGTFAYPSVNGQTNRSDLFFLDGLNDEGSFGSTYVVAPIVDDIQEFKVQSHNDDPAYGGSLGGIVNAVTKSGTNAFHGSAWEFVRNTSFDARNTFVLSRTPFQQNQFGGAIGGPVVLPGYNGRNKTFFFASYEGYRNHTTATNFYNTPTSTQLTGDLTGISGQIYNPYPLVSGLPSLTQPFACDASGNPISPNADGSQTGGTPCNKIPSSLLDSNAVKYASMLYPAPNLLGNPHYNGLDLTKSILRQDEANLRLDHNFSEKSSVWARYTGYSQPSSGSAGFEGLIHNIYSHGYNTGGGFTHTFGGTAVLDVMFGRDSANINQFTHYASNPTPSGFGFASNFYSEFQGGLSMVPNIVLSGYLGNTNPSAHNASQYDETHLSDIWEWKGDFTKNYRHHTFRMGADFVSNNADALYMNSSEMYTPSPTACLSSTSPICTQIVKSGGNIGGNSVASFLLGFPSIYFRRNTRETQHGGWVDGFYFTDQWKATSKLTANLGVRYDITLIPVYGNSPNVDYYVGDIDGDNGTYILARMPPSCAVTNAAPCLPTGSLPAHVVLTPLSGGAIFHTDTSNWQPRVGLAYQLRPSTVLRASYGRFFDNWGAITQTAQNYEGTWPGFGQLSGSGMNVPGGSVGTYENPANLAGTQPLPPPTPFGNQTWYADPFLKRPLSDQWNFGIQEALGKGTVLTVNYVGSHDSRLDLGFYTNADLTPSASGYSPSRSPYPYMTPTSYDKSIGRSSYNALQVTLNGKLATNLTYLISYTWSKSIDIGGSGWYGVEGYAIQNPYDLNADKGPSAFDVPQIFSLSWVYKLPFGKGQHWSTGNKGLDYVVGNWQFNGIATFTSGTPYTVGYGGYVDVAGIGETEYNGYGSGSGGNERMNIVGSPKLSSPTRGEWFNTNAFAAPQLGTFGDLGRDTLRSDPYKNFDLSLFRLFPITENKKLEFRFEMFNAFNQTVYGLPDAAYADGPLLFGTVGSTANVARQMQFALKLYF